jgi:hypothetical protein
MTTTEQDQRIKTVDEWPIAEKTAFYLLLFGNPLTWPAFFSGDYLDNRFFSDHAENVYRLVAKSPRVSA